MNMEKVEEIKNKTTINHKLQLDNHRLLSVSGVKNVPSFTEKGVVIQLDGENLVVEGKDLTVKQLDVETGALTISGWVSALKYAETATPSGFLKKLLK